MLEKLKTDLSAALVISAGALAGSGYLLTRLRLDNERLPTEGILSALPESFFLGVALENLVAPLILLVTFGAVWVVMAVIGGPSDNVPGNLFWLAFGVGLAALAWGLVSLLSPFPLTDNLSYVLWSIGWAVVGVGLTVVFGVFAKWRLHDEEHGTERDQLLTGGAAVLLSCVVVSLGFLAIDVRYKDRALPAAAVYTDREDCAEVAAAERADPGCPLAGFYLGEGDKWLYLIEDADASTPSIDAADPNLPGRVLLIPRDNVRQLRLDKNLKDPRTQSAQRVERPIQRKDRALNRGAPAV